MGYLFIQVRWNIQEIQYIHLDQVLLLSGHSPSMTTVRDIRSLTGMIRVVTYGSSTWPDWTVISETNPIDIIFAIGTQFIKKAKMGSCFTDGYVIL